MRPIISVSLDEQHRAVLEYSGEIRFGPAFYKLTVAEISFGERFFGNKFLWSPNSRYFAIQEWETIEEAHGPRTKLLLIDLEARRECILSEAHAGFVVPRTFEDDKLIYEKEYYSQGVVKEFEIEFLALARWQDIAGSA
jgi:hypothetical protein